MLSSYQCGRISSEVQRRLLEAFDNPDNEMIKTIISAVADGVTIGLQEYERVIAKSDDAAGTYSG